MWFGAALEENFMQLSDDKTAYLFNFLSEIVSDVYSVDATLKTICEFFGATAGCFWEVCEQTEGEIFTVRSMFNRPDLETLIEKKSQALKDQTYFVTFNTTSENTISSRIFTSKSPVHGRIGIAPFDKIWLEKEHTKGLQGLGVCFIALIPFFDSENEAMGSISLYSKDEMQFQDENFLKLFSGFFARLWENSHIKARDAGLDRSVMRHEIEGDLTVIQGAMDTLDGYHSTLMTYASLGNVTRAYNDIREKIESINSTINNNKIQDRAINAKDSGMFVSFREVINQNIQPLLKNIDRKRVSMKPLEFSNRYIELNMHPTDLGHVVRNLTENALKYSSVGTSIKVSVVSDKNGVSLLVSNRANKLDTDTIKSVWNARFRGGLQSSEIIDGTGLGLFYVSNVCEVYNIAKNFYQEPTPVGKTETYWTHVELEFPKEITR